MSATDPDDGRELNPNQRNMYNALKDVLATDTESDSLLRTRQSGGFTTTTTSKARSRTSGFRHHGGRGAGDDSSTVSWSSLQRDEDTFGATEEDGVTTEDDAELQTRVQRGARQSALRSATLGHNTSSSYNHSRSSVGRSGYSETGDVSQLLARCAQADTLLKTGVQQGDRDPTQAWSERLGKVSHVLRSVVVDWKKLQQTQSAGREEEAVASVELDACKQQLMLMHEENEQLRKRLRAANNRLRASPQHPRDMESKSSLATGFNNASTQRIQELEHATMDYKNRLMELESTKLSLDESKKALLYSQQRLDQDTQGFESERKLWMLEAEKLKHRLVDADSMCRAQKEEMLALQLSQKEELFALQLSLNQSQLELAQSRKGNSVELDSEFQQRLADMKQASLEHERRLMELELTKDSLNLKQNEVTELKLQYESKMLAIRADLAQAAREAERVATDRGELNAEKAAWVAEQSLAREEASRRELSVNRKDMDLRTEYNQKMEALQKRHDNAAMGVTVALERVRAKELALEAQKTNLEGMQHAQELAAREREQELQSSTNRRLEEYAMQLREAVNARAVAEEAKAKLDAQFTAHMDEIKRTKANLDSARVALQKEQAASAEAQRQLEMRVRGLDAKQHGLQQDVVAYEHKYALHTQAQTDMQAREASIRQREATFNAQIAELASRESAAAKKEVQSGARETQLSNQLMDVSMRETKLSALEQEVGASQKTVATREARLKESEGDVARTKDRLSTKERDLQTLQAELEAGRQRVEEASSQAAQDAKNSAAGVEEAQRQLKARQTAWLSEVKLAEESLVARKQALIREEEEVAKIRDATSALQSQAHADKLQGEEAKSRSERDANMAQRRVKELEALETTLRDREHTLQTRAQEVSSLEEKAHAADLRAKEELLHKQRKLDGAQQLLESRQADFEQRLAEAKAREAAIMASHATRLQEVRLAEDKSQIALDKVKAKVMEREQRLELIERGLEERAQLEQSKFSAREEALARKDTQINESLQDAMLKLKEAKEASDASSEREETLQMQSKDLAVRMAAIEDQEMKLKEAWALADGERSKAAQLTSQSAQQMKLLVQQVQVKDADISRRELILGEKDKQMKELLVEKLQETRTAEKEVEDQRRKDHREHDRLVDSMRDMESKLKQDADETLYFAREKLAEESKNVELMSEQLLKRQVDLERLEEQVRHEQEELDFSRAQLNQTHDQSMLDLQSKLSAVLQESEETTSAKQRFLQEEQRCAKLQGELEALKTELQNRLDGLHSDKASVQQQQLSMDARHATLTQQEQQVREREVQVRQDESATGVLKHTAAVEKKNAENLLDLARKKEQDTDALQDRLRVQQTEIDTKLSKFERESAEQKRMLEGATASVESKTKALQALAETHKKNMTDLSERRAELIKAVEESSPVLRDAEEHKKRLTGANDEIKAKKDLLGTLIAEISKLEKQKLRYGRRDKALEELDAELKAKVVDIKELEEKRRQIAQLQSLERETLTRLQTETGETKAAVAAHESQVAEKKRELNALAGDLSTKTAALQRVTNEIATSEKRIQEKKDAVAGMETRISECKKQEADAEIALKRAVAQLGQVNRQVSEATAELKEAESSTGDARAGRDTMREQAKQLRFDLKQLQQEKVECDQVVSLKHGAISKLEVLVAASKGKLSGTMTQLEVKVAELETVCDTIAAEKKAQEEHEALMRVRYTDTEKAMQARLDDLRGQIDTETKTYTALLPRIHDATGQLQELHVQVASASKQKDSLVEEAEQVTADLVSIRAATDAHMDEKMKNVEVVQLELTRAKEAVAAELDTHETRLTAKQTEVKAEIDRLNEQVLVKNQATFAKLAELEANKAGLEKDIASLEQSREDAQVRREQCVKEQAAAQEALQAVQETKRAAEEGLTTLRGTNNAVQAELEVYRGNIATAKDEHAALAGRLETAKQKLSSLELELGVKAVQYERSLQEKKEKNDADMQTLAAGVTERKIHSENEIQAINSELATLRGLRDKEVAGIADSLQAARARLAADRQLAEEAAAKATRELKTQVEATRRALQLQLQSVEEEHAAAVADSKRTLSREQQDLRLEKDALVRRKAELVDEHQINETALKRLGEEHKVQQKRAEAALQRVVDRLREEQAQKESEFHAWVRAQEDKKSADAARMTGELKSERAALEVQKKQLAADLETLLAEHDRACAREYAAKDDELKSKLRGLEQELALKEQEIARKQQHAEEEQKYRESVMARDMQAKQEDAAFELRVKLDDLTRRAAEAEAKLRQVDQECTRKEEDARESCALRVAELERDLAHKQSSVASRASIVDSKMKELDAALAAHRVDVQKQRDAAEDDLARSIAKLKAQSMKELDEERGVAERQKEMLQAQVEDAKRKLAHMQSTADQRAAFVAQELEQRVVEKDARLAEIAGELKLAETNLEKRVVESQMRSDKELKLARGRMEMEETALRTRVDDVRSRCEREEKEARHGLQQARDKCRREEEALQSQLVAAELELKAKAKQLHALREHTQEKLDEMQAKNDSLKDLAKEMDLKEAGLQKRQEQHWQHLSAKEEDLAREAVEAFSGGANIAVHGHAAQTSGPAPVSVDSEDVALEDRKKKQREEELNTRIDFLTAKMDELQTAYVDKERDNTSALVRVEDDIANKQALLRQFEERLSSIQDEVRAKETDLQATRSRAFDALSEFNEQESEMKFRRTQLERELGDTQHELSRSMTVLQHDLDRQTDQQQQHLSALEQDIFAKNSELQRLDQETKERKEKLVLLEMEIVERGEDLRSTQDTVSGRMENLSESFTDWSESIMKKRAALQRSVRELDRDYTIKREQLHAELSKQKDQMHSDMMVTTRELQELLREQKDQHDGTMEEMSMAFQSAQREHEGKMTELTERQTEAKRELHAAQARLREAEGVHSELTSDAQLKTQQLQAATRQLDALRGEVADTESKMRAAMTRKNAAVAECDDHERVLQTVSQAAMEKQSELNRLSQMITQVSASLQDKRAAVAAQSEELMRVKQEVQASVFALDDSKGVMRSRNQELELLDMRIKNSRKAHEDQMHQDEGRMQEKIESKRSELEEMQARASQVQFSLRQDASELERTQRQLALVQAQVNDGERAAEKQRAEVMEAERTLADATKKLEREQATLTRDIATKSSAVVQLDREYKSKQKELRDLEQDTDSVAHTLRKGQRELSEVTRAVDSKKREAHTVANEEERARQRMSDAQKQLQQLEQAVSAATAAASRLPPTPDVSTPYGYNAPVSSSGGLASQQQEQYNQMSENMQAASAAVLAEQKKVYELKQLTSQLTFEQQQKQQELDMLTAAVVQQQSQLDSGSANTLAMQLQSKQHQSALLSKEIASLDQAVQAKNDQVIKADSDLFAVTNRVAKANRELRTREQENKLLETQVVQMRSELTDLQKQTALVGHSGGMMAAVAPVASLSHVAPSPFDFHAATSGVQVDAALRGKQHQLSVLTGEMKKLTGSIAAKRQELLECNSELFTATNGVQEQQFLLQQKKLELRHAQEQLQRVKQDVAATAVSGYSSAPATSVDVGDEQQVQHRQQLLKQLEDSMLTKRSEILACDDTLFRLRNEIAEKEHTLRQKTTELESMRKRVSSSSSSMAEATGASAVRDLEWELQQKQALLRSVEQSIAEKERVLEATTSSVSADETDAAARLSTLQTQVAQEQQLLTHTTMQVQRAKAGLQELKVKLADEPVDLPAATFATSDTQSRLAELQGTVRALRLDSETKAQEVEKLKQLLDQERAKNAAAFRIDATTGAPLAEVEDRADLEDKLVGLQVDLDAKTSQVLFLKNEITLLEQREHVARTEASQIEGALRSQLRASENERLAVQGRSDVLERDLREARTQLAQQAGVSRELELVKRNLADANALVLQEQGEVRRLTAETHRLQDELNRMARENRGRQTTAPHGDSKSKSKSSSSAAVAERSTTVVSKKKQVETRSALRRAIDADSSKNDSAVSASSSALSGSFQRMPPLPATSSSSSGADESDSESAAAVAALWLDARPGQARLTKFAGLVQPLGQSVVLNKDHKAVIFRVLREVNVLRGDLDVIVRANKQLLKGRRKMKQTDAALMQGKQQRWEDSVHSQVYAVRLVQDALRQEQKEQQEQRKGGGQNKAPSPSSAQRVESGGAAHRGNDAKMSDTRSASPTAQMTAASTGGSRSTGSISTGSNSAFLQKKASASTMVSTGVGGAVPSAAHTVTTATNTSQQAKRGLVQFADYSSPYFASTMDYYQFRQSLYKDNLFTSELTHILGMDLDGITKAPMLEQKTRPAAHKTPVPVSGRASAYPYRTPFQQSTASAASSLTRGAGARRGADTPMSAPMPTRQAQATISTPVRIESEEEEEEEDFSILDDIVVHYSRTHDAAPMSTTSRVLDDL